MILLKYLSFTLSISPIIPQTDLQSFTRVIVHCRKESDFQNLIGIGFGLAVIPEDTKIHFGPPVKVGTYGCQVFNRFWLN